MTEQTKEQPQSAETIKPEKTAKESPYAVILKRLENIEAKMETKSAQTANVQSPIPAKAPLEPSPNQETEHTHEHNENNPHFIGTWQQYCPTCGDKNPEFKDEVECGTCHTNLGAEETATKLKACPNCGGKKAIRKPKK